MSVTLPPLGSQPQATGPSRFGVRGGVADARGGKATPERASPGRRTRSLPHPAEFDGTATLEPESSGNTHHHNRCLELLVAGHVTAFIEMFDLSGRDPDQANLADNNEKLTALQLGLAKRDNAAQAGDRQKEHDALAHLADTFEEQYGDLNTAKHFRESTLSAAGKLAGDAAGHAALAAAHEALGLVHEKQGATGDAVAELQQMRSRAKEAGGPAAGEGSLNARACGHLVRLKVVVAEGAAGAGKHEEALELLKEAMALAKEGDHAEQISNCWFRLGNAYEILGESQTAIEHLSEFMVLAQSGGDERGQNRACSVLAKCYERLGDMSQAAAYLERLIETSSRAGQHRITSEAAARLGTLYGSPSMNEFVRSVHWHTRAFEAAKEAGSGADLAWITACQIRLGQARARAMAGGYSQCMVQNKMPDLVRLLMWKSHREESFTDESTVLGFSKPGSAASAAAAPAAAEGAAPPAPPADEGAAAVSEGGDAAAAAAAADAPGVSEAEPAAAEPAPAAAADPAA